MTATCEDQPRSRNTVQNMNGPQMTMLFKATTFIVFRGYILAFFRLQIPLRTSWKRYRSIASNAPYLSVGLVPTPVKMLAKPFSFEIGKVFRYILHHGQNYLV